jgi:hypothetical protein
VNAELFVRVYSPAPAFSTSATSLHVGETEIDVCSTLPLPPLSKNTVLHPTFDWPAPPLHTLYMLLIIPTCCSHEAPSDAPTNLESDAGSPTHSSCPYFGDVVGDVVGVVVVGVVEAELVGVVVVVGDVVGVVNWQSVPHFLKVPSPYDSKASCSNTKTESVLVTLHSSDLIPTKPDSCALTVASPAVSLE